MTLTVQIDELKDAVPARKTDVKYDVWGLEVQSLNPELARSMGIAALHGVLVTAVKEDSPAALAGLVRGDVIEAVTGMDTPDIDALNRILASLPADKPALIAVHRKDGSRVLTIKGAKG